MTKRRHHPASYDGIRQHKSFLAAVIILLCLCSRYGWVDAINYDVPIPQMVLHFNELVDNNSDSPGCIACHGASNNANIQYRYDSGRGDPTGSHTVGTLWPEPWQKEGYATVDEITAAGLRLYMGRMACISCHNLNSSNKYLLALPIAGSQLCFGCHRI